ncbi:MAG: hypothetical protein GX493_09490 [Firmicutes bacterium]|nr:hypothetical protein [Bacillota bacterium]
MRVFLRRCFLLALPAGLMVLSLSRVAAESARCQVEERNGTCVFQPSQIQGSLVISYEEGRLGIDATGVPLSALVRELSAKTGRAILCDQAVTGIQITVYFPPLPLEEALGALAAANGLRIVQEGEVHRFLRGGAPRLISVHDGRLTLDIWNVDIKEVLVEIARQGHLTILPAPEVSGFVTGTIVEAELVDGLNAFLRANGFTVEREEAILWVKRASIGQNIGIIVPEESSTEVIPLRYLKAEEALKLFPSSLPKDDIVVVKDQNALAVTGSEDYRAQVRAYLEKLDVSAPMILFDVLVLQLSEMETRGGGLQSLKVEADGQKIEWDLGSLVGTIIAPGTAEAMKLSAILKAAISEGRAKVRANPKIVTLSGTPAHFNVLTKYNYTWAVPVTISSSGGTVTQIEYKTFTVDSGIQFNLIPWVSANKNITLELNPRITTIIPSESLGLEVTALPGVTERSTQTTIRIMDGYTVVISGFIQESEEITQAKVPILGSIPILGRLFQSTKRTKRQDEFVIIITPRLIEDPTEISDLVAKTSGPGSTSTPIVIDWS